MINFNFIIDLWLNSVYNIVIIIQEGDCMHIVPIRDLKDTVKIEELCSQENGPVFVTKNGYGRLVVMDIDYWSRKNEELEEAMLIARGLKDIEEGNVVDGPEALINIRNKYGL